MKLGIVSDIHCQYEALLSALEAMGPVDRLICAGDAIDQTRFCARTVGILREPGFAAIRGNHEAAYFARPVSGEPGPHDELSDWLRTRPADLSFMASGASVRVVHATAWDDSFDYVPPSHRAFGRFADCGADIVIYGHTHVPVAQRVGEALVVNPGSTGEGRPDPAGFIRSCAVVDCVERMARIIDLD